MLRLSCPSLRSPWLMELRVISFQKSVSNYSKICCASSPKKMSHFARANKVAQIVKISPFCRIMAGGIIWWSSFAPKIFFYFHSFPSIILQFLLHKKIHSHPKGACMHFHGPKKKTLCFGHLQNLLK